MRSLCFNELDPVLTGDFNDVVHVWASRFRKLFGTAGKKLLEPWWNCDDPMMAGRILNVSIAVCHAFRKINSAAHFNLCPVSTHEIADTSIRPFTTRKISSSLRWIWGGGPPPRGGDLQRVDWGYSKLQHRFRAGSRSDDSYPIRAAARNWNYDW